MGQGYRRPARWAYAGPGMDTARVAEARRRTPSTTARRAAQVTAVVVLAVLAAPGCNPGHPPARGIDCSVGVVGDSLMVGVEPYLPTDLAAVGCGHVFTDALTGRLTGQGAAVLEAADLSGVDLLVIGLGTNDWQDPERLGALVDRVMAAADGRRVVWVNVGGWLENKEDLNLALFGGSVRWDDLWVLDWDAWISTRPHLVGSDGIHLTRQGYVERSQVIARFIATGRTEPA